MDTTKPDNTMDREQQDDRDRRPLVSPQDRVFGPPCQVTLDWNAAIHQQRLLATLPHPSSHQLAYNKWLRGHRMERDWSELSFLERAEWVQFYFDTNTEDLKVTELGSDEIQDNDEAEAKEYMHMAQRTIIPLKLKEEVEEATPEPKFYYEDPGAAFKASGSATSNVVDLTTIVQPPVEQLKLTRTQELILQERGSQKRKLPPGPSTMQAQPAGHPTPSMSQQPGVQSAPSMSQAPVYNQLGPLGRPAPSMAHQDMYNQFPATGPVYLNQYRGPWQGPKKG